MHLLCRYQGLAMNTFGKSCDKADPGYMCPRSGDDNTSTVYAGALLSDAVQINFLLCLVQTLSILASLMIYV